MHDEASYVYTEALHRTVECQVCRDQPVRLWRLRVVYWGSPLVTVAFCADGAYSWEQGDRGFAQFMGICGAMFAVYTVVWHAVRLYNRRRALHRWRHGAMRAVQQTIVLSDTGVMSDMKEFGNSHVAWISFCVPRAVSR